MEPLSQEINIRLCVRVTDTWPEKIIPGTVTRPCDRCGAICYYDPGQVDRDALGLPVTADQIHCTRCNPGDITVLLNTLGYTNAFERLLRFRRGRTL